MVNGGMGPVPSCSGLVAQHVAGAPFLAFFARSGALCAFRKKGPTSRPKSAREMGARDFVFPSRFRSLLPFWEFKAGGGCSCHRQKSGGDLPCGDALGVEAVLRCGRAALHYLELLPSFPSAGLGPAARSVAHGPGADAWSLPVRGCRLRGHAGPHSSADFRATGKNSLDRGASGEIGIRPASVELRCSSIRDRLSHLAAPVLRFQCVESAQRG